MNDPEAEHVSDARVLQETPRPGMEGQQEALPPLRPGAWLLRRSPLHWISLGMGSGLSPVAPGTVGTLWAWLAYAVLSIWLTPQAWGIVILIGLPVGWWACTVTARTLRTADPSCVVWDEVIAFWIILWVISPAGWLFQLAAFAVFRLFDAAKPGPVGWADRLFKGKPGHLPGWAQGAGIIFDDLVAALCTLLVLAWWVR
jgi:phosphatidylglycerophosphatase A